MTTNDDYLLFQSADGDYKIEFTDAYSYTLNSLIKTLNCKTGIKFEKVDKRTIRATSNKAFEFVGGTHRAKLITGLYNTKKFVIEPGVPINVPDLPVLDFANKFYLVSLQGVAVSSSINNQEYTPSVIANIDSMFVDNEPLIVNYDMAKPIKIKCNTDSLKYLEMRLVDFMYQPVVLKSPLFITIKIKPAGNADIFDVLTK